jgi:transcriptional regulator with XRE-family HTH domain
MDEPKPMRELTRIREERGLSQQGLADASGVNKATINQIERGRRSPNLETLEKLAGALAVEMAYFFPKAQAPLLETEAPQRRGGETAEKLLRFGRRMVAQWETELPERLEAEDEEWLRHTWTMYSWYIDILNSVRPDESSNKQELLSSLIDINAAAHRIQEAVRQHNERSREVGKKELVLQEIA